MEFRILGHLEVEDDQHSVALGPEKQRAVLALLLLNANHTVTLDRLIEGLWSSEPPGRAVKAIQTYVSRLRKVLPDNRLSTRPHGYSIELQPDELDLSRFERLLAEGQRALADGEPRLASQTLREALALWRGSALAEFAAEPFASSEGARLEELRVLALESRLEADLALGRHAEVVAELELLVTEHPLRERLRSLLMLALYRSGRHAEALAAYRDARSYLVEELGIEPSRSLHDLEAAILRQDPALDRERQPEPPQSGEKRRGRRRELGVFVGRDAELARLTAALDDALAGAGGLVMVSGEQGIGKTRVAMELAARAEARGASVLWGRCYEREGAPPYWPWVQVIRGHLERFGLSETELRRCAATLAEIVPEIRDHVPGLEAPASLHDPKEARFRLLEAIAGFLSHSARERCLLIVLDSLHASDAGSLLALEFVAREVADMRLLVLGTYRDVELTRGHRLTETLAELTREHLCEWMPLRGLTEDEVGQLAQEILGPARSAELIRRVHEQTEGNALFVTEILRLLAQERPLPDESSTRAWSARVPESVRVVIGRRLDRLSPECNEALRVASVIGREFSLDQLCVLMQHRSDDELIRVLEEALDAHVLEELQASADRYRFTHRLMQDTLVAELSTTKRVRLHARIADALERLYGPDAEAHAAELARHFAEAETVIGPAGLVRYARVAGQHALEASAYEEALEYFQRALDAKDGLPMDDETARLLVGLARSEFALRERYDLRDALDHLRRAFTHFVESGDEQAAVEIATYPIPYVYGAPEAADLAARALTMVPATSSDAGHLLSTLGWFTGMRDREAASAAFTRSASIARDLGDRALERRVLISEAHVDFWHLDYEACLDRGLAAISLARGDGDERAEMVALSEVTRMYTTIGRASEAERDAARTLELAERFRERYWLVTARVNRVWLAALIGDWDTARMLSDEALALQPQDARSLATRALVESETGNGDLSDHVVERLLEARSLSTTDFAFEDACAAGYLPMIAWISDRSDLLDAAEEAAQAVLASEVVLPLLETYVSVGRGLAAVSRDDARRAQHEHDALEHLEGSALTVLGVTTDRVLGLLSKTAGDLASAIVHFERGLDFSRRAGYRPEYAWTACDYAATLLDRDDPGDRERAADLRNEASGIAHELAMEPLTRRLQARRPPQ